MSGDSADAETIAVICGPTAAGKSAIALALAASQGRSILVADSRQVYRRFDIGTAKPTAEDLNRVSHDGISVADPTDRFSASRWVAAAETSLVGARRDRRPIVVGGTGMYLRALFEGLFIDPSADDDRRGPLMGWLDGRSTEELRRWTQELDPARAHLGRTQLLRAVAVALLTGDRISRLYGARVGGSRWTARYLVVDPGPALSARIEHRLDAMLDRGWMDEVRSLGDVPDAAPAWKATGYRVLRDVVRGRMNLRDAREHILIDTRQYAKRQRTWFRHQLPERSTTRVNPAAPDASAVIDQWWAVARQ